MEPLTNTQAPSKICTDADLLMVHSIFYTIQGEGPYAGQPAVFIRMAECNLQCPGCDTEYTAGARQYNPTEIVNTVKLVSKDAEFLPLVVITGGEPLRQNLTEMIFHLRLKDYRIQIETNGTLPPPKHVNNAVEYVCSPKTGCVNKQLLPFIMAYKYVINANSISGADGLPNKVLDHSVLNNRVARPHEAFFGVVYVQPEEPFGIPKIGYGREFYEQAYEANKQAALKSCLKYGYIMQLQIHKLLGVE